MRRCSVLTQLAFNLDIINPEPDTMSSTAFRDPAFEQNKQDAVHRWVPWIAGFSAGFVADALQRYVSARRQNVRVLDPFAGVGTTLVEGLRRGYDVIGFEVNPFAALASRVKCSAFEVEPQELWNTILTFEDKARQRTADLDRAFANGDDPTQCLPAPESRPPAGFRSRVPFFSPTVERKVLHCLDIIREIPQPQIRDIALLAFGAIIIQVSNYSYEPSLGSRAAAGKANVLNADVVGILSKKLREIYDDLRLYRKEIEKFVKRPKALVINENSLFLHQMLPREHIDIVITSPPYLNNYHYLRNTRPHLFWLNLADKTIDLKKFEHANFGKYWQTVRGSQPIRLNFSMPDLEEIIESIAIKNPEKGVYGGRGWANYATEYFNDCHQICMSLQHVLKSKGIAVFVLGNSIIQGVNVHTDCLFGNIGELCGLKLEGIHPIREKRVGNSIINSSIRNGDPKNSRLYESAVILRKP